MATLVLPPDDWEELERFLQNVNARVEEYADLPFAWRIPFREEMHFASMVDEYISGHIKKVFALEYSLSGAGTLVKEEGSLRRLRGVFLDIYTELYLRHVAAFYSAMTSAGFRPITEPTNREGALMVLTLSLSSLHLTRGGLTGARHYLYRTVYGNDQVEGRGTCLIVERIRMLQPVRTSKFVTSPALLLFEDTVQWDPRELDSGVLAPLHASFVKTKGELEEELLSHLGFYMTSPPQNIQSAKVLIFPAARR